MLKSGVPLSQALELLAENMTNKEFGAKYSMCQKGLGVERSYLLALAIILEYLLQS